MDYRQLLRRPQKSRRWLPDAARARGSQRSNDTIPETDAVGDVTFGAADGAPPPHGGRVADLGYETAYAIQLGYGEERTIIRP